MATARWEEIDDQPNYDDPDLILPGQITSVGDEADEFLELLENRYCLEVGGFFSFNSEGVWDYGSQDIDCQFVFRAS